MLSFKFSCGSEKEFLVRRGYRLDCNGATAIRRWETSQAALLKPLTDSSSMEPVNRPEPGLT